MNSGGSASLVGRTIAAKFLVLDRLGSGAMGDVYRAKHLLLDREVALKVLHPSLRHDESFAARFHREARAASRLDHPNCVAVLDFGEDDAGLLYIAMELLQGVDLFEVIHKEWPIDRFRIIEIMRQTLAGVARAHESGIVHRDLKPENIMILRRHNDDGEEIDWVKVCDFGIAKMNDPEREDPSERRLSLKGHMMGTPEYMSPEQARGDALDVRSDIYALGVVLYQMLVGRVPFEGTTPIDIAVKHLHSEPVPPRERLKGIDPALEIICLTAMSKDPSQRYQSAREMRAVLRAAQDGRPLSSVAPDATGAFPSVPPLYTPPPSSRMSLGAISEPVRASHSGSILTPVGVAAPSTAAPKKKRTWVFAVVALLCLVSGAVGYTQLRTFGVSNAADSTRVERLVPIPIAPMIPPSASGVVANPPSASALTSGPAPTLAHSSDSLQVPASASAKGIKGAPSVSPPVLKNGDPARNSDPAPALEDAAPSFAASHNIRVSLTSGTTGNLRTSIQSRVSGLRACYVRSLESLGRCAGGQATLTVNLNDKQMVATATLSGADFLPSLASCSSIFPGLMIEEPEAPSATFGIAFTCD